MKKLETHMDSYEITKEQLDFYSGFNKNEIYVNEGDVVYPKYNPLGETAIYDKRKKHRINYCRLSTVNAGT